MRLLKETIELRADSEAEAKSVIEQYRVEAVQKGYTIGAAGYTYKEKKAKGEVVDRAWVCKVVLNFSTVWEELE